MRIVHFAERPKDARAMRAAFHASDLGHEIVIVVHKPGKFRADTRLVRVDDVYAWPCYETSSPSGVRLAERIKLELKPDVVHCHELDQLWALVNDPTPEKHKRVLFENLTMAEAGIGARRPAFPLVYDAHEDEQGLGFLRGTSLRTKKDRAFTEMIGVLCIDAAITVSPALRQRLFNRFKIDAFLAPNAPPRQLRSPHVGAARDMLAARGIQGSSPVAMFAGYGSAERQIPQLTLACYELKWNLAVVGELRMWDPAMREQVENVGGVALDHMPYPHRHNSDRMNLLDVLSAGDVGFAGADLEIPNWQVGLPNKVFEYAFAGVPICAARMPDAVELIERYGIGTTFDGTALDLLTKLLEAAEMKANVEGFKVFHAEQNYDVVGGPNTMTAYKAAREHFAAQ